MYKWECRKCGTLLRKGELEEGRCPRCGFKKLSKVLQLQLPLGVK